MHGPMHHGMHHGWSGGCWPGPWVPVMVCVPLSACCGWETRVPEDLEAKAGATAGPQMVGGRSTARLSVEYLIAKGAASPLVKVTVEHPDGSSASWSSANTTAGYHVDEDVLSAVPGSQVTLASTDATARVRWCETICC
jgi:hypothetical protein